MHLEDATMTGPLNEASRLAAEGLRRACTGLPSHLEADGDRWCEKCPTCLLLTALATGRAAVIDTDLPREAAIRLEESGRVSDHTIAVRLRTAITGGVPK